MVHADTVVVDPVPALAPRATEIVGVVDAYLPEYSSKCVLCHAST